MRAAALALGTGLWHWHWHWHLLQIAMALALQLAFAAIIPHRFVQNAEFCADYPVNKIADIIVGGHIRVACGVGRSSKLKRATGLRSRLEQAN